VGVLTDLIRRSVSPSNPDRWMLRAFGAEPTQSGVHVDEHTAISSSAIWAGVRLISESLSTVPLHVYRMRPDGQREVVRDHPVDRVLYSNPNPEQTAQEWRSQMLASLILAGNSYNEVVRDGAGRVRQVWPLSWWRVELKRGLDTELYYQVSTTGLDDTTDRQTVAVLPADKVLHLRAFNVRGLLGDSMVKRLRETIGISLATEKFGASFYGNGTNLSGVLVHPGTLSEGAQKRLKETWRDKYSGLSRSHQVAILEEGMKFEPISVPPEASQFIETRQFQIQEAARALNLPPHMLRDLSRATFSNIEHQAIEFVVHSLRPWAVILEQRMAMSLLTEQERAQGYYIRHTLEGLLRGDIKTRYDAYAIGRNWGWLSANDVRALEDLNSIEGGDSYLQPMNMMEAGAEAPVGIAQADEPDTARALRALRDDPEKVVLDRREHAQRSADQRRKMRDVYRPLIRDATQTIAKGEARALRKAIEVNLRGASSMEQWARDFYGPGFEERVRNVIGPVIAAYQRQIGLMSSAEVGGDDVWPNLQNWVESYIEAFAARYAGYSRHQILRMIEQASAEEMQEKLEALATQFEEERAEDVASEETVRAGAAILRTTLALLGITRFRWVADADPCDFCREIAGTVVTTIEPFAAPNTTLSPEGASPLRISQKIMHPPLHRGCQCEIVPD
jgi:HK97 family phage portal protein